MSAKLFVSCYFYFTFILAKMYSYLSIWFHVSVRLFSQMKRLRSLTGFFGISAYGNVKRSQVNNNSQWKDTKIIGGSTIWFFQHHNKWLRISQQFSIYFILGMGKMNLGTKSKHNDVNNICISGRDITDNLDIDFCRSIMILEAPPDTREPDKSW